MLMHSTVILDYDLTTVIAQKEEDLEINFFKKSSNIR